VHLDVRSMFAINSRNVWFYHRAQFRTHALFLKSLGANRLAKSEEHSPCQDQYFDEHFVSIPVPVVQGNSRMNSDWVPARRLTAKLRKLPGRVPIGDHPHSGYSRVRNQKQYSGEHNYRTDYRGYNNRRLHCWPLQECSRPSRNHPLRFLWQLKFVLGLAAE